MNSLLQSFHQVNTDFYNFIIDAIQKSELISADALKLSGWPNLIFTFEGEKKGSTVDLVCAPDTYWQNNVVPGYAQFKIEGAAPPPTGYVNPNQSIVGLPLMNNYYTVFDRSQDSNGVINFAPIAKPS